MAWEASVAYRTAGSCGGGEVSREVRTASQVCTRSEKESVMEEMRRALTRGGVEGGPAPHALGRVREVHGIRSGGGDG